MPLMHATKHFTVLYRQDFLKGDAEMREPMKLENTERTLELFDANYAPA
jgi:hypothetical protein